MPEKFFVNEEKRTVVCILTKCSVDAIAMLGKLQKNVRLDYPIDEYEDSLIPDKIVGVARCAPEDEFDVEKGKALAFSRAKIKYYKAVERSLIDFRDKLERDAAIMLEGISGKLCRMRIALYNHCATVNRLVEGEDFCADEECCSCGCSEDEVEEEAVNKTYMGDTEDA